MQDASHDTGCTVSVARSTHTKVVALTAQSLQIVVKLLQIVGIDIADISHQVCHISSAVCHLLVDVVIAEDLVDCRMSIDNLKIACRYGGEPFRKTPGTFW